jgi:hypothetical protein
MTPGETPENRGLTITIKVHAYDSGLLKVDGRPVDPKDGWIGVGDLVALTQTVFHEKVGERAAARTATTQDFRSVP